MDPALVALAIPLLLAVTLPTVKLGLLSPGGAAASALVGVAILAAGWSWLALMLTFFALAMLATELKSGEKAVRSTLAWGKVRTWRNVSANGGLAASFALAEVAFPSAVFAAGFLGAVSAATADVLATELGLLYPGSPRLLVNPRRKVPPGTSGAVSPLGFAAAAAGSAAIGSVAWLLGFHGWPLPALLAVALLAGMVGSTLDSALGCTVQSVYRCGRCGALTEDVEHCGTAASLAKGIGRLGNNAVNAIGTCVGSVVAIALLSRI